MASSKNPSTDDRQSLCRQYGLRDERELYELVVQAGRSSPAVLLQKSLTLAVLRLFGYTEANLGRLGWSSESIQALRGQPVSTADSPAPVGPSAQSQAGSPSAESAPSSSTGLKDEHVEGGAQAVIKNLIAQGVRAPQLKQKGWTVGHLRRAGLTPLELERCGFQLEELAQWYPCPELRRFGYGVRDLRRIFRPQELRSAGFSAVDMRNSGATIRDLLQWGYNENEVRTAGFSILELQREGLSKQTVDHTKKGH
jgi:intracellular multiplication protein IcmE